MHFSKTYAQLLLTLPPELQQNAIEYRQLKKLINKVVLELSSLGLSPAVLHGLLHNDESENVPASSPVVKGKERAFGERPNEDASSPLHDPTLPATKAVYELAKDGDRIEPRLRLWVTAEDSAAKLKNTAEESRLDAEARVGVFLDRQSASHLASAGTGCTPENDDASLDEDGKEEDQLVSGPVARSPGRSLVWTLQRKPQSASADGEPTSPSDSWETLGTHSDLDEDTLPSPAPTWHLSEHVRISADGTRELVIPLASDTAFFQLLFTALQSLSAHLLVVRQNFAASLRALAEQISQTARPQSATSWSFHPSSSLADPSSISSSPLLSPFSSAFVPGGRSKSDLYAWREIFQLYVEAEVFEDVSERTRGERDLEEAEQRLALFAGRVAERGLGDSRKLRLRQSRDALETFLQMNVFILNLKKFQQANAEAARKILKKHAKRTALALPIEPFDIKSFFLCTRDPPSNAPADSGALEPAQFDINSLMTTTTASLPHVLVQAIGETLLPVIPHIDDFECLICMSIAFKPIRLACRHLFCVRCLVKMQKRGQDHCPCCRAPVVLKADKTNVDWALVNFMQDWFPLETKIKLKQNEQEVNMEQLEELGLGGKSCTVM